LASVVTPLPTLWPQPAVARTEQIGRLIGATVYAPHFARAHIVPGDIIAGSHFGVLSAEDDVEAADREEVQRLVDGLAAAGNNAHGEMLSATEHHIAEIILQSARDRSSVGQASLAKQATKQRSERCSFI
jgi:hypothetical protein